ncbi:MAG: carboxyl transferase domain-containing protein [Dehalococcoidia bacterium]|nr:carboxyl transferase domain-containing protein [Dehalococcoidia bacterium]
MDEGSGFEIQPGYGRSPVTQLARIDGHVVGIVANDPTYLGGTLDGDAKKETHFIKFCDVFNIPLISVADVPA